MSEDSPVHERPDPWEVMAAWTERTRLKEGIVREAKQDVQYLEVELPEGALEVHLRYPGGSLVVRRGDLIEANGGDGATPKSEAIREAIAEGRFSYPLRPHSRRDGESHQEAK